MLNVENMIWLPITPNTTSKNNNISGNNGLVRVISFGVVIGKMVIDRI